MNSLIANILLGIWLTISGSIWLLGSLWAGKLVLPPANGFSLIGIYLPWLLLIALIVSKLMVRQGVHD